MKQSLEQKQLDQAMAHYLHEHQRIAPYLPGSACIQTLRAAALARFAELKFPGSSTAATWKYTSIAPIVAQPLDCARQPKSFTQDVSLKLPDTWLDPTNSYRLVFIDGHHVPQLSPCIEASSAATVTSLSSVSAHRPEILEEILHRATTTTSGLTALNAAFIQDGAYIHLPANTLIDRPIELLFVTTTAKPQFTPIHNSIIIGENCQVIVLERYYSVQSTVYFNNIVTELTLNQAAQIQHYKLIEEGTQAAHISQLKVQQQQQTDFRSHVLTLRGKLTRNEIQTTLNETHAQCQLKGLYFSREKQHVNHTTMIEHIAPHTQSHEHYNGVVGEHSRAVFNGKIIVHPKAVKSHAQQLNKNLLLSSHAEIDTKPELEIFTDDVHCRHGATIGQLADDALFYLCTRGIPLAVARAMLIRAFIKDIVADMPLFPASVLYTLLQEPIAHANNTV